MAGKVSGVDWDKLVIGMFGGDKSEQEIARLATATGTEVRAYGFPWPEQGIPSVKHVTDPAAMLNGAKVALFLIPGIADNGVHFAPATPTLIIPNRSMLAGMTSPARIILGRADGNLKAHTAALLIKLHEYEWDKGLMLRRGPAIIEGLIKIAIENTAITIHRSHACVVGHRTGDHRLLVDALSCRARRTQPCRGAQFRPACRGLCRRRRSSLIYKFKTYEI